MTDTRVSERAAFIVCDNPSPMTLEGTNTWILRQPGGERSIVIDPGPLHEDHLQAVLAAAAPVGLVLFTHRHRDHTDSIDRFTELSGAPSRAADPAFCRNGEPLADGETIELDGLTIEVVATPGHTDDSVSFHLADETTLLSGDTILGRGTTIIAHPEGALGPYLDSMAHIREMVEEGLVTRILPAHGPVIEDAASVVDFYIEHREERLDQVRAAVADGAVTAREVVERVYTDVDESMWPHAERSVRAQLEYLQA